MLMSLAVPIVLSAVALFLASFVSWMVLKLHWKDWQKLPNENAFLEELKRQSLTPGGWMMPGVAHSSEMNTPEFQQKIKDYPRAIMTVLPEVNMGLNLLYTLLYFLVISYFLAYIGTQARQPGANFLHVFQFIFSAALPMFLGATVANAIWFRPRITGHVIESVCYAAITATIFAGMWPGK